MVLKKSRNTRQRAVILDILRQTRSHPTAEHIYREARRALPNISLGTVYRNLNFLRDQGAILEIRTTKDASSRFDGDCTPHGHFHCVQCREVTDIPLPEALDSVKWEEIAVVSDVHSVEISVVGSCSRCADDAENSSAAPVV